ncbi:MAG: CtsR family transcriptional regulator [Oscillospiraceae bacterium]|nr:CtsR family transcriptional regulator [Oscillospiraceae bacterium]
MRISNEIARFIYDMLHEADGVAELQRGALADRFNCAPSQINYVIATRFSPERGYIIESRRGGGGYIRITRVRGDGQNLLMHAVSAIGQLIDARSTATIIDNLRHTDALDERQSALLAAATSDNALRPVPQPLRDTVRANIFKHTMLSILERR